MFKPSPIEIAIEIPSGKIVFRDDLRQIFTIPEGEGYPQNASGPLWSKLITEAYGRVGLLHGYVGNSCPNIHKQEDTLIIGNPSWDKKYNSRKDLPGESIGSICTDLWWYSIADKDEFLKQCKKLNIDPDKVGLDGTVDVTPGRYVLKHYYPHFGRSKISHGQSEIYAVLQLSNDDINNCVLPEEGIAELVSSMPYVSYSIVKFDKDKLDEINKDESKIFQHYEIMIHWITDTSNFFTAPKFNGEEFMDHDLVRKRVQESYEEGLADELEHKELMRKFNEDMAKMTPEQREEHNKQMDKIIQELLDEDKNK